MIKWRPAFSVVPDENFMRIKSQKDFFAGLIFLGSALFFGWGATNYRIGSSAHMGPGYFPLLCSIVLGVIGLLVCLRAVTLDTPDGDPVGGWAIRPLVFIILANVLFGILLEGWAALHIPALGFVVATMVLLIVAARAGPEFRAREVATLTLVLTLGSWLVFAEALHMQFLTWPAFFGG